MAWLILVLGAALGLSGAAALWSGISYMPVEWGWSQLIAGATAVSSGVVTIALAAVVHRLRSLQTTMLALGTLKSTPDAAVEEDEPAPDEAPLDPDPEIDLVAAQPDPPGPPSMQGHEPPPMAATAASFERPSESTHGRRVGIADVQVQDPPPLYPELPEEAMRAEPVTELEQTSALSQDGATLPHHQGETQTVVGRYEAGGASYALFSDGTIEVETETGTHRFGSMGELKAFLERRDRADQATWSE